MVDIDCEENLDGWCIWILSQRIENSDLYAFLKFSYKPGISLWNYKVPCVLRCSWIISCSKSIYPSIAESWSWIFNPQVGCIIEYKQLWSKRTGSCREFCRKLWINVYRSCSNLVRNIRRFRSSIMIRIGPGGTIESQQIVDTWALPHQQSKLIFDRFSGWVRVSRCGDDFELKLRWGLQIACSCSSATCVFHLNLTSGCTKSLDNVVQTKATTTTADIFLPNICFPKCIKVSINLVS